MSIAPPHPKAWPFSIPWHERMGHRSVICVPLMLGEQTIGFMGPCFATDIALDKTKQELVRALAHQMTLAIELLRLSDETRHNAVLKERNRLAREVHDTLAQGFTGILVQMEAAEALVTHDHEKSRRHLKQARALARASLLEARRTLWAIRPLDTDEGNLADALEQLVSRLCRESLAYRIVCTGEPFTLPPETHYEMLRIAQETFINAVKHAQAQTLSVALEFGTAQLHLTIRDDGCGMDMEQQLRQGQGLGLIALQERAERIGAIINIDSKPNQGTCLHITLPVER